ncbi:MAG TPA: endonuclease Q family protein, partial [Candidatus Nanoarchaeia archaeon]|nr:endonuclease Q family protein [Candidatus Nanoarchaeia archaeon]
SDGRPILKLNSIEFVENLKKISKEIEIICAHAWTPWFGIFGSKSGFDSLKECYQDKVNEIHAIETGMSSTPDMNWRLSSLDNVQLVSFSDSHSFWPWRIGREATIFDIDLDYRKLQRAIQTGEGLTGTVETWAEYGKYHLDGHRDCGVWYEPEQSKKYNYRCPKCRKKLTIGVLNRVEQLADRPLGYKPKGKPDFHTLLPLAELIAGYLRTPSVASKQVLKVYNEMLAKFPSEFHIMLDASAEQLYEATKPKLAELILLNRAAKLTVQPGYDGVYGKLLLDEKEIEQPRFAGQKSLVEFD